MKQYHLECTACELHKTAYTVGMEGRIGSSPKLAVFLDYPNREDDQRHRFGVSRSAELLRFLLKRMSIDIEDIAILFSLRCTKGDKQLKTKANRLAAIEACSQHRFATLQKLPEVKVVVALGAISCEAFLNGAQLKDKEGTDWSAAEPTLRGTRVFVGYSLGYALQDRAETVGIYRLLWRAAEAANLNPKTNLNQPQFNYDN